MVYHIVTNIYIMCGNMLFDFDSMLCYDKITYALQINVWNPHLVGLAACTGMRAISLVAEIHYYKNLKKLSMFILLFIMFVLVQMSQH
jgi:hypothetical protein